MIRLNAFDSLSTELGVNLLDVLQKGQKKAVCHALIITLC